MKSDGDGDNVHPVSNSSTTGVDESFQSLRECVSMGAADEDVSINGFMQRHAVLIPKTGWYGFYFGSHDEKEMKGTFPRDAYCLYLQNEKERCEVKLPFTHRKLKTKDECQSAITSIIVGKLLHLPMGAKVVVFKATKEKEKWEHLWKIVHVAEYNKNIDVDHSNLGVSQSSLFLASESHVICSICGRKFDATKGALSHATDAHRYGRKDSGDNMWNTPLHAVYEDECMVVIVKPQGMAIVGASPCLFRSDLLMRFMPPEGYGNDTSNDSSDALRKPKPVHRLDAPTGGLLVVAKTKSAEQGLKNAFADRVCKKRYSAVVWGKLEPKIGECSDLMGGKQATTRYCVVRYVQGPDKIWRSIVDLFPVTGRRHQLRKHMKSLGHSIIGDSRYGLDKEASVPLHLWHVEISLPHPVSGKELHLDHPSYL